MEKPPSDRDWDCRSADREGGRSSSTTHDGRRLFNRAHDAIVRTAAADIAIERLRNLRARGLGVLVEQRLGRDQNPGQAIAALAGLFVEKCLLQGMRVR